MANHNRIRIIIADDHVCFRDGLKLLLASNPLIDVVGEAQNGAELIDLAATTPTDIVITDIRMPGVDGVVAAKQISRCHPGIRIIALSMYDDASVIIEMLDAGVLGFVLKNADKTEIIEAVTTVYQHKPYYCTASHQQLARMIAASPFDPYKFNASHLFTSVEINVIRLLCAEKTSKEIAAILHLSFRTVEGYRKRILDKMQVKNLAGIVTYSIQHGIYAVKPGEVCRVNH